MWAIHKTSVPTPTKPPVSFWTVTLLMCPHTAVSVGCPDIQLGRGGCCLLPFTQKTDEVWEALSSTPTALPCHVCFTYSHHWAEDEQHHPKMQPVGDATYLFCNKSFNNISPIYGCKVMVSWAYTHELEIIWLTFSSRCKNKTKTKNQNFLKKKKNTKNTPSKNCRKG